MEELRTLLDSLRGNLARLDAISTLRSAANASPADVLAVAVAARAVEALLHTPCRLEPREQAVVRTLLRLVFALHRAPRDAPRDAPRAAARPALRRPLFGPRPRLRPRPRAGARVPSATTGGALAGSADDVSTALLPPLAPAPAQAPAPAPALAGGSSDSSRRYNSRAPLPRSTVVALDTILRDADAALDAATPGLPSAIAKRGAIDLRAEMQALRRRLETAPPPSLERVRGLRASAQKRLPTLSLMEDDERAAYEPYYQALSDLLGELDAIDTALA